MTWQSSYNLPKSAGYALKSSGIGLILLIAAELGNYLKYRYYINLT